jgi:hypothetical protein
LDAAAAKAVAVEAADAVVASHAEVACVAVVVVHVCTRLE